MNHSIYLCVSIFIIFYMNSVVNSQLISDCLTSCTPLSDCPSAYYDGIKYGKFPSICYYDKTIPYICCPKQNVKRCSLLDLDTRISAENDADPEKFEFMVGLSRGRPFEEYYACGGTLIHKSYVLTAAHCLYSNGSYNPIRYALVGGGSVLDGKEPIKIVSVSQHPDYHLKSKYHDIAILKLEKEVNYQSACLAPPFYELLPQTSVVAVGYGKMSYNGSLSDSLLKADLKIYSQINCTKYYGTLLDSQLCALGSLKYQRKNSVSIYEDTCQGDSGGPLVMLSRDSSIQSVVVGIVSYGFPCGNGYPGVYTKVSAYYNWIKEKISND